MDSHGNFCGMGELEDYPYLYFLNFQLPLTTVCVKECPKFDYNSLMGKDTSEKMDYERFISIKNLKFDLNLSTEGIRSFFWLKFQTTTKIHQDLITSTLRAQFQNRITRNTFPLLGSIAILMENSNPVEQTRLKTAIFTTHKVSTSICASRKSTN